METKRPTEFVAAPDPSNPAATASAVTNANFAGSNVFILFDTSNYMYRGFMYAQDAIVEFVRSLEGVSKVALYPTAATSLE